MRLPQTGHLPWTCAAKSNGFASRGRFRFHNFNHRGNYFARFFDHDRVADSDIFAFDFVFVMQRCATNRASAHEHGLQHRYWRENSSAPNLNYDVA